MKKAAGFSIIELAVTLAVGAILIAVAVPAYIDLMKDSRLTTQANTFVTAMNLARSEALKQRVSVDVTPLDGVTWASGFNVTDGGDLDRDLPLDGEGVTFTATLVQFTYLPNGRVTAGDSILICDDRSGSVGRRIDINATGRVSVRTENCP